MNLNRIILYVGDTLRCAEFYRDMFNLSPAGEWTSEWAELDGGGCRLAFHQAYDENGPITRPTGSPRNPHKLVFTVDDVAATRERLFAKGVQLDEIHYLPEHDNLVICDGSDPEGHRFQLCNR